MKEFMFRKIQNLGNVYIILGGPHFKFHSANPPPCFPGYVMVHPWFPSPFQGGGAGKSIPWGIGLQIISNFREQTMSTISKII
jgi:hypothetical protein